MNKYLVLAQISILKNLCVLDILVHVNEENPRNEEMH